MNINDKFDELAVDYARFHGEVRLFMNDTKGDLVLLFNQMNNHKKTHDDDERFLRQFSFEKMALIATSLISLVTSLVSAFMMWKFHG